MSGREEFPFAALSNPVRTDILSLLAAESELSVTEISQNIPTVGRTAISMNLGILLDAGLVTVRREGRHSRYSLDTSLAELAVEFLQTIYGEVVVKSAAGANGKRSRVERSGTRRSSRKAAS